jgi:hypothetical protein
VSPLEAAGRGRVRRGYESGPGFDRPFFIGQGTHGASTPAGFAAEYVSALEQNGEPVTFKSYDNDHLGTWIEAQRDEIPFVRGLFARKGG